MDELILFTECVMRASVGSLSEWYSLYSRHTVNLRPSFGQELEWPSPYWNHAVNLRPSLGQEVPIRIERWSELTCRLGCGDVKIECNHFLPRMAVWLTGRALGLCELIIIYSLHTSFLICECSHTLKLSPDKLEDQ